MRKKEQRKKQVSEQGKEGGVVQSCSFCSVLLCWLESSEPVELTWPPPAHKVTTLEWVCRERRNGEDEGKRSEKE